MGFKTGYEVLPIAQEAHKLQTRWNKDPYIKHPMRVAIAAAKMARDLNISKGMIFTDNYIKVIIGSALLHDVIEDTPMTDTDLLAANVEPLIVYNVVNLTKDEKLPYSENIKRAGSSLASTIVKICDIDDNKSPAEMDYNTANSNRIVDRLIKYNAAQEDLYEFLRRHVGVRHV